MLSRLSCVALSLFLCAPARSVAADKTLAPEVLQVDASYVGQGLIHADLTIPASPGPLTLDYPLWIPGEHGPTGSTMNIAGFTISSNGHTLPWRRDLVQLFQFHTVVPLGAKSVELKFDYIDPIGEPGRDESDQESTPNMGMISWNHFTFYPDGLTAQKIPVKVSVTLPNTWTYGTGLETESVSGSTVSFRTESLYTVVDSPLLTGDNLQTIPLTPVGQTPRVELDLAADTTDPFTLDSDKLTAMKSLVQQAEWLFGSEHFRHYNFLIFLSDHLAEFGLEHSESNETGFPPDALEDDRGFIDNADTPAHEFFHSWNGKFRRPLDLATPEYIQPERTDLLWVYEGLTQYYGFVLSARSGMLTQVQVREHWASELASYDHETGRSWRSLQDTADDAPELYNAPNSWQGYRRDTDFYWETSIDWLDADAIIRRGTGGKKSLDDFCRLFYSQPAPQITAPVLKPYTEADVIAALNQVYTFDWQKFWDIRLNGLGVDDLDQAYRDAGWSLVYNDTPNERAMGGTTEPAGFRCNGEGDISDVAPNSIAFKCGLAPGVKIVAIDGFPFSRQALIRECNAAQKSNTPLQLIIESASMYRVISFAYYGGLHYPHLQPTAGAPDLLSQILTPISAPGAKQPVQPAK